MKLHDVILLQSGCVRISDCPARLFPIVVLLALALASGCGPDGRSSPEERPNIIFLTVDTLRPDHMETYGYGRSTMPNIAAFAESGVVFDNAVVPRSVTRPSYASMLSGLYPHHHGVRSNRIVLHEDVVTLPEILGGQGYHTAGFVSNFVLVGELSGMDQGFDLYDDLLLGEDTFQLTHQRRASATLHAMNQWLASEPPEPYFLFVHFIDPHGPYSPPEKYREMYKTNRRREVPLERVPDYQVYGDSTNYYDYVDRYDAEARYTDDALGAFIERLRAAGMWDDALVVFVADHGEALGEHGQLFGHRAYLWEETTRVPMVVRLPEWPEHPSSHPSRIQSVVSPLDLMPTVLDMLDIEAPYPLDGRSLLPVLAGEEDRQRTAFMEYLSETGTTRNMYAVRGQDTKLVRLTDPATGQRASEAIFDLARDPYEKESTPLDPNNPIHLRLQSEMDSIRAEMRSFELPFTLTEYMMPMEERSTFLQERNPKKVLRNLSPEQIERLKSLGYIQ